MITFYGTCFSIFLNISEKLKLGTKITENKLKIFKNEVIIYIMKTKVLLATLIFVCAIFANKAKAENEQRNVPAFSEISFRISGTIHLIQGNKQSVEIVAQSSTLEDIITEVKGRQLIIRLPVRNIFTQNYNSGKIDIYITVPEVQVLSVSGSGNIIAEEKISSRIIDLAVSGSGNIVLNDLDAERVKTAISGSGYVMINGNGIADELIVAISGSGNVKAESFEAKNLNVSIAGSGNCSAVSNGSLKISIFGSGNVYYRGNPSLETSVTGSGKISKM